VKPRRILDAAALWGTATLVVAAILLLASISYTGRYTVQLGAALVGVVWCLRLLLSAPSRRRAHAAAPARARALVALALAPALALPLLPLPPSLVRALSPSGFDVMTTALPGWPERAPLADFVAAVEMVSPLPGAGAWRPLSLVPWDTLTALSIGAAYVVVGALVAFYPWRDGTRAVRRLVSVLIGVALVLSVYGFLQASTGYGRNLWFECYRPVCMGTYSNKDHFAGLVEMVFPVALAAALARWAEARRDPAIRARRQGLYWRLSDYSQVLSHPLVARTMIAAAMAFLLFVALPVSGARSAFLATFAAMAVMLPLLPPGPRDERSAGARWRDWLSGGERRVHERRHRRHARRRAPRPDTPAPPMPGADEWSPPSEDIAYEYPLRTGFSARHVPASPLPTRTVDEWTRGGGPVASPFEKGGLRGICPNEHLGESPLPPLFQRGEPSSQEDRQPPANEGLNGMSPGPYESPAADPGPLSRLGEGQGEGDRHTSSRTLLFSLGLAALAVFYLTFPQIFPRLWAGEQARHWMTLDTLNLALRYPLFGTGFGTYAAVFPLYKPYTFAAYEFGIPAAHNDYVQWLAEVGLPATLLTAALLGLFGRRVVRSLRAADRRTPTTLLRWGLATGIVAMLVHSFTDFNLHIPANALVFSVLVGALIPTSLQPPTRSLLGPPNLGRGTWDLGPSV